MGIDNIKDLLDWECRGVRNRLLLDTELLVIVHKSITGSDARPFKTQNSCNDLFVITEIPFVTI